MILDIWSATGRIFSHFRPFFARSNPENQNFEKIKTSLKISSFHKSAP